MPRSESPVAGGSRYRDYDASARRDREDDDRVKGSSFRRRAEDRVDKDKYREKSKREDRESDTRTRRRDKDSDLSVDEEDRRRRRRKEKVSKRDDESDTDEERAQRRRERKKRREKERDKEGRSDMRDRSRSRSRDRESKREQERDGEKERASRYEDMDRKGKRRKDSRSPSPSSRQRRKEAKAASRAAKARELENDQSRALAELSMYTGADKPFHDANLSEQFVWKKKRDKERKAGLSMEDIARKDAFRREEAKTELAKLNKKRADREAEMALRDADEARQARLAEDAQMREWINKEDDFQLEQARRRAGIRLREQRAKAIDFLAINLRFADAKTVGKHTAAIGTLNPRKYEAEREEEEEGWGWADAGFEFEIDEPWRIFDNLNLEDCEELEEDIKMYLSLEKSPINIEFWDAMQIVCDHYLSNLRDPDHAEGGRFFNKEVDASAGKIVAGLSYQRLVDLEKQTNTMLRSGQPVDGEFWDLVLKKIDMEKAIARLNAIHEVVLKNRLEQFKKRQREDAAKASTIGNRQKKDIQVEQRQDEEPVAEADGEKEEKEDLDEDDWVEEYEPEMSPPPANIDRLSLEDRRLPIVDEVDHWRAIYAARHALVDSVRSKASHSQDADIDIDEEERQHSLRTINRPSAADLEAERMVRAEAQYEDGVGTDDSENEFGDLDDALDPNAPPPQPLDWSDRYRPRKPRYFNRVHTGYEWNKFNQVHYDTDNPPPKVVQGYKFNIFYPDLIDKTKAPTYRVKKIPDDNDTEIIIFTAGPPYEDIAFRIVKKQWEYSHRRGFRSTFDRGVLQLYFSFNRMGNFHLG